MDRSTFRKLKRSLLRIREDIRGLLISRFIFKEVQRIIASNPAIQIESSFYEWMGYVYITHAVVGVRRHFDKDSRSLSLLQFLEAVEKYSSDFTKKRFQRLYPQPLRTDVAPKVFRKFSGNRLDHVNPAIVRKDIRALRKAVRRISHFTNKRVAHLDKSKFRALPNFNQLDNSLDELERLVKKYILLFFAEDTNLVPIWQYDWKQIFRHRWIPWLNELSTRASTAHNRRNHDAPSVDRRGCSEVKNNSCGRSTVLLTLGVRLRPQK